MRQPPPALDYATPRPTHWRVGWVVIVLGLLLVGAQLWLLNDLWLYRPMSRVVTYGVAIGLCFLPPVQRLVAVLATLVEGRTALRTTVVVSLIAAGSIALLYATAVYSERTFLPVVHDEFVYLIQAQMLARGHLWMSAHPLAAFFDTFYVITDRAYAAQYFPGTAFFLVPGVWLGLPTWAMPLVVSGLAAGAVFLVLREVFNGTAALAGVVVLLATGGFRVWSIAPMSTIPALLLGCVVLWALLRWDDRRSAGDATRWIVVAGVAMGWLAITRPLDGVAFGVAGVAFVVYRLRRAAWAEWRRVAAAGLLPLVPFAALQLAINRGVTGEWLTTPFGHYQQRDMPGTGLGFHMLDPDHEPVSPLPQKRAFYESPIVRDAREHTFGDVIGSFIPARVRPIVRESIPDMLLLIVVPAGLLMIRGARRWLVVGVLPAWIAVYTLHGFLLSQYYLVFSVSVITIVLAGFDALAPRRDAVPFRASRAMQFLLPIVVCILVLPQFERDIDDAWLKNPVEADLRRRIAAIAEPRAIVLVRFAPPAAAEQEVVFNYDTGWPDDARVIRAHDLGDERNAALYRYYADRQPDRAVYRYDRGDGTMTRLGFVTELARTPTMQ